MDFLLSCASWCDPDAVMPKLKYYKSVFTLSDIITTGDPLSMITYRIISIKRPGAILRLAARSKFGIVLRRVETEKLKKLNVSGVYYEIVLYDEVLTC